MPPQKISPLTQVRKRDGRLVDFDLSRISSAVSRAMQSAGEGDLKHDPQRVAAAVKKDLEKQYAKNNIPDIENIQDAAEKNLILMDFLKTAKAYILYRHKRAEIRKQKKQVPLRIRELVRESKKYFRNALAEFIFYRSYSRWLEKENRRETWIEAVDRYFSFMKENMGDKLSPKEYQELREAILRQEIMPSMRLLWSAGEAARATNVAAYNCSFIAPSKLEDFADIMYVSMCGAGVGFSVESQTAQALPQIKKQSGRRLKIHFIEDSKEGWCAALTFGLKTWFFGKDVDFDYSRLRPEGSRLKTMGGKSSGPGPLKELLNFTRDKILARQGRRLSNIDVHDLVCKIGEIVVSGGVRRSALISLSDLDDQEMRDAKKGQFYLKEPQRSLANNSAVYNQKPTGAQFLEEWLALMKSGSGERGIFNRGGLEKQMPERRWKKFKNSLATSGSNPCLAGDTLVYAADGRGHVPIRQLAEENKDVPVFCFDDSGKITVRFMRNPRLTGKKQPVYKVTFDDGSSVRATNNHKFRLKSGEYKEVKNLRYGDSLDILTKFEASIKDIFPESNDNSQNYWWLNRGFSRNEAEHRIIAEFFYNMKIPKGRIIHHKDRNAQNNLPENLEIMSKEEHDRLHSLFMFGDNNPMRRAAGEWSQKKWAEYSHNMSLAVSGDKNGRFSGITHDELQSHALILSKQLGRRFSNNDWINYAKKLGLPQHFSKWRQDHLGGVLGLAKWAAQELELDYIDADPRAVDSYKKYTAEGYNCEIINGRLIIIKSCEVCGKEFRTRIFRREYGVCSISCGLKRLWSDSEFKKSTIEKINQAHSDIKEKKRTLQLKIYSDLKFKLGKAPLKAEWAAACAEQKISSEISRNSSPFRNYGVLKERAKTYNHKVISVEFCDYEDVYNGTVDEFHNFFIGGFVSITGKNKKKFVYINNRQCGEIILKNREFCNLTEVVARREDNEKSLLEKTRLAAILGTYQSMLTNFHFISKEWKKNCEEERLLGVSITGQWDSPVSREPKILRKMRDTAVKINQEYAKRFGINPSAAITCVKPSGTVSQLVDASSGMHPRHSPYYIRRVRISATDSLFQMLKDQKLPYKPEVGQTMENANTYIIEFPVKSPKGAVFRNDLSALDQLEHWKKAKENFTEHNPSVTVSIGENEWVKVAHWLYENWEMIGGLSFLPREDHVYKLAPYEEITKEQYEELSAKFPKVDFSQIVLYEMDDATEGAKELACVAGVCEI